MIFNPSKTALYGSATLLALSVVLGSTTALAAASACDDSFQYTCTDSYEIPYGRPCGGKYKECGCSEGGWYNGRCVVAEIQLCVRFSCEKSDCYSEDDSVLPDMEIYLLHGRFKQQRTDATLPSSWSFHYNYKRSCVVAKVDPSLPIEFIYPAYKRLRSDMYVSAKFDLSSCFDIAFNKTIYHTGPTYLDYYSSVFANLTLSPEQEFYFIDFKYEWTESPPNTGIPSNQIGKFSPGSCHL